MIRTPTCFPPIIVAIPVKNEASRITNCLEALSSQVGSPPFAVLLLLNNCSDNTATIVDRSLSRLSLPLRVCEVDLPPSRAHAGYARFLAMELAAELAGPSGIIMTTDADGRVGRNWMLANLAWLHRGCDAVAGRAEIDPGEASLIPAILHEDDARECAYAAMLDQIAALLDPDSYDPWPRHDEHSGASIAVTAAAYYKAGGIPPIPLGEDRGFFDRLRMVDARIRHAPDVRVVVSGRTEGRAAGGMADTIRRRMLQPDVLIDERLEPAFNAAGRAWLRRQTRLAAPGCRDSPKILSTLSEVLKIDSNKLARALRFRYFGEAWSTIEKASPLLVKHRVPVKNLDRQTRLAAAILNMLQGGHDSRPDQQIQPILRLASLSERDKRIPACSEIVPDCVVTGARIVGSTRPIYQ
jgi:hypothetical protein